jgi:hypothetical protein
MTFGEDWGWGASPDVSATVLDLFADVGGNVVDTADVYTNGTSETILGASCSNDAATGSCSPPSSPTKRTRVIRTVPATTRAAADRRLLPTLHRP